MTVNLSNTGSVSETKHKLTLVKISKKLRWSRTLGSSTDITRRTNNRKVVGLMPANVVCISTVDRCEELG